MACAATIELASNLRTGQPDRPGGGETLVEDHIAAGCHRVSEQGVAGAVAAGQLRAAAIQNAGDSSTVQLDRPDGGSESHVKEYASAGPNALGHQGLAIEIAASQAGAATAEQASDVRVPQLDCPRGREAMVKEYIAADTHPRCDQRGAICVAASQGGAATIQHASDVRAGES